MSDSEIMLFRHEQFGEIRTLNIDGKPWFVGKDITSVGLFQLQQSFD